MATETPRRSERARDRRAPLVARCRCAATGQGRDNRSARTRESALGTPRDRQRRRAAVAPSATRTGAPGVLLSSAPPSGNRPRREVDIVRVALVQLGVPLQQPAGGNGLAGFIFRNGRGTNAKALRGLGECEPGSYAMHPQSVLAVRHSVIILRYARITVNPLRKGFAGTP